MIEAGPFSWEEHLDKEGDIEVMIEAYACGYSEIQSFWIKRDDALATIKHLIDMFGVSDEELKSDPPV